MAASVSPSATSRARRSYLALPDLRGDGVDQLLGAIARGGEEHRRVAALPPAHHHADHGQPAPGDRHPGEEGQAPLGRGVRPDLARVAFGDQGVVIGDRPGDTQALGSVTLAIGTI
jgi:hypothetical protein